MQPERGIERNTAARRRQKRARWALFSVRVPIFRNVYRGYCALFDPYGNQSKNHPRLHHPAGGGSLCKEADDVVLRSLAHAAFQRQGLAGHILEIRHGQLDADTANLRLSVAVVAMGGILTLALKASG